LSLLGIREVFAATPQLVSLGNRINNLSLKDMKKAELPGETTVFMDSPHDSQDLECDEEFYDAIMAADQDEEDETEDQELVTKEPNMVCYLHVLFGYIVFQSIFLTYLRMSFVFTCFFSIFFPPATFYLCSVCSNSYAVMIISLELV
jgi:hypothetical protein